MRRLTPLLLTVLFALPLAAQHSPRHGFFLSIGAGAGSAGLTCSDCGGVDLSKRLDGVAGYARFGGTVSPNLQVGVEGTGWIKNSDGLQRRIATAGVVFVAYPSRTAGFFLKGAVGGVRAVIENDVATLVGEGLMWSAGLGYDIPLGTGAALTPYVSYFGSSNTGADLNGVSLGVNLNPNVLQFGIGITIP
jgi:hypothetical protein